MRLSTGQNTASRSRFPFSLLWFLVMFHYDGFSRLAGMWASRWFSYPCLPCLHNSAGIPNAQPSIWSFMWVPGFISSHQSICAFLSALNALFYLSNFVYMCKHLCVRYAYLYRHAWNETVSLWTWNSLFWLNELSQLGSWDLAFSPPFYTEFWHLNSGPHWAISPPLCTTVAIWIMVLVPR